MAAEKSLEPLAQELRIYKLGGTPDIERSRAAIRLFKNAIEGTWDLVNGDDPPELSAEESKALRGEKMPEPPSDAEWELILQEIIRENKLEKGGRSKAPHPGPIYPRRPGMGREYDDYLTVCALFGTKRWEHIVGPRPNDGKSARYRRLAFECGWVTLPARIHFRTLDRLTSWITSIRVFWKEQQGRRVSREQTMNLICEFAMHHEEEFLHFCERKFGDAA